MSGDDIRTDFTTRMIEALADYVQEPCEHGDKAPAFVVVMGLPAFVVIGTLVFGHIEQEMRRVFSERGLILKRWGPLWGFTVSNGHGPCEIHLISQHVPEHRLFGLEGVVFVDNFEHSLEASRFWATLRQRIETGRLVKRWPKD